MTLLETPPPSELPTADLQSVRPLESERAFFIARDVACETHCEETVNDQTHRYVSTEVDGFAHSGWYTAANEEIDSGLTVVVKPGWGEIVDQGIGKELHFRLAKALPEVTLFSHETDGMGNFSKGKSVQQLAEHGLDQMAEQGHELLKRVSDGRRVITIGTSMGSVILSKLLTRNIDQGEPVEIAGVIYHAPAHVDPSRVVQDMILRFGPELVGDIGMELLARTEPRHMGSLLLTLVRSKPHRSNLLPLGKQGIDLLRGTPGAETERVLAHYPVDVIVGGRDSVGQAKRWLERDEIYDNLVVHLLAKRGHGIAINPYQQAKKMSKTIRQRYIETDLPTTSSL